MESLIAKHARHPVTGEFSTFATKHVAEGRFGELWHPAHYTGAVDITGLSNHAKYNEGGVLSAISSILYPFQWENEFFFPYPLVARDYWYLPYVFSVIYIYLVLHLGPKLMQNREPVQCGVSLKYWNRCWILIWMSFAGMIRTVPHLLLLLRQVGWAGVICQPSYFTYGYGPCGLWTALFITSKVFEFIDTLFLIIRKRPVSLLHWWHHSSVLLYCWDALMWETPSGIVFVAMNYSVHALMYFYYYLAATINRESQAPQKAQSKDAEPDSGESTTVEKNAAATAVEKPKRKANPIWWAHYVTKLQIIQMIVGLATVGSHLYFRQKYENCDGATNNLYFAGLIYFSYFILFGQFYIDRYKGQIVARVTTLTSLLRRSASVKHD